MGDILPYLNVFPVTDEPEGEDPGFRDPSVSEGITEETSEEPETKVYETDEYVPLETDENGNPISLGLPEFELGQESSQEGTETSPAAESTQDAGSARETSSAEETTAQ